MYFTRRTVAIIVIPSASGTQWRGIQPGTWLTHTVSLPGHYRWQRHWKQWAVSVDVLCTDTIAALIQAGYAKTWLQVCSFLWYLLEFSVIFVCLSQLRRVCVNITFQQSFRCAQSIALLLKSIKLLCQSRDKHSFYLKRIHLVFFGIIVTIAILKGQVHPKIKTQPLSSQPHAGG